MNTRFLAVIVVLGAVGVFRTGAADLHVKPGVITDNRTTGQFFNRLEIKLILEGKDVAKASGVMVEVTKAVDSTGKDLMKKDREPFSGEFEQLQQMDGMDTEVSVELENPERAATTVKELQGTVRLHLPEADPAATVTLTDFKHQSGKPFTSPALEKAGIEVIPFTKDDAAKVREERKKERAKSASSAGGIRGAVERAVADGFAALADGFVSDGELNFSIKDPNHQLVAIQFVDAKGEPVQQMSSMRSGDTRSYEFQESFPADGKVLFRLSTEKSIVTLPFSLKDVELP